MCSQNSKEVIVAKAGKKGSVVAVRCGMRLGARSWMGTMVRTLRFILSVQEDSGES